VRRRYRVKKAGVRLQIREEILKYSENEGMNSQLIGSSSVNLRVRSLVEKNDIFS